VAVDDPQLVSIALISAIVVVTLLIVWRPLTFASIDSEVAAARGVATRSLSVVFMVILGLAVAASIQVVGALLVLSLLVTPAAAAVRVSKSPIVIPMLSVAFAMISVIGGILLALGSSLPISPYVTSISFLIYLVARAIAWVRNR
jgi:zinc/manganese transport system permease protein